jgi:dienelactone hydrolase
MIRCAILLMFVPVACPTVQRSPGDREVRTEARPPEIDGRDTAVAEATPSAPDAGEAERDAADGAPTTSPETGNGVSGPVVETAAPVSEPVSAVQDLAVEGFHPAAFVAPRKVVALPAPLVVVLHGNFDRPEWECDIWREVASDHGWLLCPRGYPRTDVDPALDRWTYQGRSKLEQEIGRGVEALQRRFPDAVRAEGSVLVGFSLGAHMAIHVAGDKILPFSQMVLGEGGFGMSQPIAQRAARQGIERVVYLCGEKTYCPQGARRANVFWKRARVDAHVVVMPGVGHGYATDFDPFARQVFDQLFPM